MESEKYLFVFETDSKDDLKDNLPDCNSCTCWPCDENCFGRKRGISRQEAIERMAKAIKSVPKASGEVVYWQDYNKWAEAALNALLEGK